jgi:CBS domain-containing protein
MTRDPAYCTASDTVVRVAKFMKVDDIGCLPVCESRHIRMVIGIVTDRDLALHVVAEGLDPFKTLIKDAMTKHPVMCRPEDDVQKALEAMQNHQVRRIPIVDEDDFLIGIISQADIARLCEQEKTAATVEEISKPGVRAA